MFGTESEKFNHRVVDIQFIEVDEKQALKSPNIGIRHDDNVYQLGDELENSHDWPEGNWTETELDGACAIDVADACSYDSLDELKEMAIRRLNDSNEYLNENVYLISGTSHEYGNDPNEVILRNPEVIGILKLVRWDELSEEEQEQYRKRQEEMSDEEAAEVDEVDEEHNKGFKFTYDGKDAGELSGDIFEALEILDRQPKAHDTESLREKYRERLVSGERTIEFDKKQLANVNKAISILESAPNTTKEEFEKEFGPDSDIMMTIKYPSSDGLAADLAYEKEGGQKSINMDQHRVDVLKRIDPNKLQWKKQKTETFNQSAWHGSPYDLREFLLEMIGAGAGAQAHGWGDLTQNKDLPEEYRRQLTAFVYEPGWTEEQMSAARLYSERDMAKAVIAQNTESPAEGWRSLYNDFTAARDEILQPAIDALSKGMKQGVDILPLGEDGRGIRVSNNAPWYQEYYKEHGKAPNQAQLRDLAYLLTVGDASAPNVEGWIPTTREAAEAMDAARGELDELNGHIKTLENIKERMMKVDSFEVKGSTGLSPEGYKLYRQIIEMLEKIGGEQKEDKQTKVARMNAMLFAHHADIFAAAMRTQEGKEKYTALDYFRDRFALRYGGTDMREGADVLHQAVRAGLNLDEQVQVVDFDTLTNDLKGKSDKEIIAYISKLSRTEPIPVADFKALVGLPKDNDRYGQRHLIRGKANQSAANRAARNTVLSNFRDVVQHAVVVEVVPNTKKKSLHGLQGAKWRTQKRKNEVENYYRLMVPVHINGRIRTLVIVAEECNGVVSSPTSVKVYEIYYAKKHPLATAPITEPSSKAGAKAGVSVAEEDALSKISIRDMLTGVKDADGNVYAQSAWHGSPHDFVEFLLSAIGTGEGAQAHGWGLYFAKNRRTSEGYKKRLAKITQEYYAYDGKEHKEYDYKDPIFQAMSLFQKSRV